MILIMDSLDKRRERKKKCTCCGNEFLTKVSTAKYCPDCRPLMMKKYQRAYWEKCKSDPEYRERYQISQKNYRTSPKGRKVLRRANLKWQKKNREYLNAKKRNRYHNDSEYRSLYLLNQRIRYYDKCCEYWWNLEASQ